MALVIKNTMFVDFQVVIHHPLVMMSPTGFSLFPFCEQEVTMAYAAPIWIQWISGLEPSCPDFEL
jgi:hypothetical protein